jgi:hypothetical protein
MKGTSQMFEDWKLELENNKTLDIKNNSKKNNIGVAYIGINSIIKGFKARSNLIRDENNNLVTDINGLLNRWKNYFYKLFNLRKY